MLGSTVGLIKYGRNVPGDARLCCSGCCCDWCLTAGAVLWLEVSALCFSLCQTSGAPVAILSGSVVGAV
jgi:hypothetical protein